MSIFFFQNQNSPIAIFARLLTSPALFFLIFFVPWWVTALAGIIASFYFKWFLELIFLAYLSDFFYYISYGRGIFNDWHGIFHFSLFALTIVLLVEWLRPRLLVR